MAPFWLPTAVFIVSIHLTLLHLSNSSRSDSPQVGLAIGQDCVCSSSLGVRVTALQCAPSCTAQSCRQGNPDAIEWNSFEQVHGQCCTSSFWTSNGCSSESRPITVDEAENIIVASLSLAESHTSDRKAAFVVPTSTRYVDAMEESFKTARKLQMNASRSGAQFFFSGDYNFILKSVQAPEYDTLAQITDPARTKTVMGFTDGLGSLDRKLRDVEYCRQLTLEENWRNHEKHWSIPVHKQEWNNLIAALRLVYGTWTLTFTAPLFGAEDTWVYMKDSGRQGGKLGALWCEKRYTWRIFQVGNEATLDEVCASRAHDELYKTLQKVHGYSDGAYDIDETYTTFMEDLMGFERRTNGRSQSGPMSSTCSAWDYPVSLMNEYVLAFTYEDSYWVVLRNSINPISNAISAAGFESFKNHTVFDAKPFPIYSDDRGFLFHTEFARTGIRSWKGFQAVRRNIQRDIEFMDSVLPFPLVDYSLLAAVFYIDDPRSVLDHVWLPNCVEGRLEKMSGYGSHPGAIVICFSIIDNLMEFTYSKSAENALLRSKWTDWGKKFLTMFDCLGSTRTEFSDIWDTCAEYRSLKSNYIGLDVEVPKAQLYDATDHFSAEGIATVKGKQYKCCCNEKSGLCKLTALIASEGGWFDWGTTGCGSLDGSGWHSFKREAKKCILVDPKHRERERFASPSD